MTDAPPLPTMSPWPCGVEAVTELSRFVDVAPDPMVLVGADWRVIYANSRLCQMLGRPLESLVGAHGGDLLDSRDRRYADARTRAELGLPTDRPVTDREAVTAVRGDGARVPVTVAISRLEGRYRGLILATLRDVTTDVELEARAGEVARVYAMLAAANAAVLRSDSRDEVYDELCRVVTTSGDFCMAWVGVGTESGALVPVAASGDALKEARDHSEPVVAPMAEQAWRAGQLVVVDDLAHDPLTMLHHSTSAGAGAHSGCAIPVRCRGEVVAVFTTCMDRPGAYQRRRLDLLERLVDDVSFALQTIEDREREDQAHRAKAVTEAQLAVRVDMHAELSRLGRLALSITDLDELYDAMVKATHTVLGTDVVAVEHVRSAEEATLVAQLGLPERLPGAFVPGKAVGTLHALGAPVVTCSSERLDEPALTIDPTCRWAAAVQITRPEGRLDVLVVGSRTERLLARDETDFLQTMASIAAVTAERLHANRHLHTLAFRDPLTGLPNRARLFERIEALSARSRPGHAMAMLLIDLDGFKDVNDALGHDIGDRLLVAVADRLRAAVGDRGETVARLGGDEFAVLCSDLPGVESAIAVAEAVSRALDEPFVLGGLETFISSSIGITVCHTGNREVRTLLREADAALYAAKESGRARWELFDDQMRQRAVERLELSNALRQATDTDQLQLVWQPVVGLRTTGGRPGPVSLEALLRWDHPTLGRVAPDRFIGLAEETGLIVPIGEWVIGRAFAQLATWNRSEPDGAPRMVTVNLSARQLAQRNLVPLVQDLASEAGVDPRRVAFEITETAVLAEPAVSIHTLTRLRELGFSIAIDDFGTGYSSLAYLRDLPADALKVDRSFVSRLGSGGGDDDIVRSIVSLAHGFGLVVVGEGVETVEQRDALVQMGCDRGQGYLWSPPMAPDEVPGWIRGFTGA